MQKSTPNFKYHLSNPGSEKYLGIEMNGEIVHWIEDTEKFFGIFGFSEDMRQNGVLPEEFIWGEYTNNRTFDFTACLQMQIIEYLRMHSRKFLQKYGDQCETWLAELASMRTVRHDVCENCKIKPVCSN